MSLLKTAELARRWQVDRKTILRLVNRNEIVAVRIGGQLRFHLEEVERYEQKAATK